MTVAMFLSKPRPILISDCLALPSSGGVIHYSPSNIEFSFGSDCKLASLVSKILFLDGSTIVAFSGRSDNIGEFAQILQERWAVRDTALRPMQYVHRLDSEIRAARGSRWECSVLGASIKSFGAGDSNYDINSYASLNDCWSFETEKFGKCHAIGTGARELRDFTLRADSNPDANTDNTADQLVGALNGRALFLQKLPTEGQTWGGLIQSQTYVHEKRSWFRSPPWFHVCVIFQGHNLAKVGVYCKYVLHISKASDQYSSAVLSTIMDPAGNSNRIWEIYPPTHINGAPSRFESIELLELPKLVTITSIIHIDERTISNHFTFNAENVKGVEFAKDGRKFNIDLDAVVLCEWVREIWTSDPASEFFRAHR